MALAHPNIRKLLETALAAITPAIATAYENQVYTPIANTPYQLAFLLAGQPANPEIGAGQFFQDQGIFQVNLCYPSNNGPGVAEARAELIRAAFYQGASFTIGSTTVTITRTPSISQGRPDGDRWIVPVKITYVATGP